MASLKWVDGPSFQTGELATPYTAGGTSLALKSGHGERFPQQGDYWIRVDQEILIVTGRTGDTLTVIGAQAATVASDHAADSIVRWLLAAPALEQLKTDITGSIVSGAYENWIDLPPAVPNAMDDEFTGSVLNPKWKVWNQQSGDLYSVGGHHVSFSSVPGRQSRFFGILQPVPAGTWRFRTKTALDCATWYFMSWGTMVRRITGGDKSLFSGAMFHSGYGQPTMYAVRCAGNPPAYNGQEWDLYDIRTHKFYIEIEYDGTNLIYRFSVTGAAFSLYFSEVAANSLGGAPEYIGIGIHPWANEGGALWGSTASFDWFRRVA